MIKIDTSSIENWNYILDRHREYIENNILENAIHMARENGELYYLFTGNDSSKDVANALTNSIENNLIKNGFLRIVFGQKSDWSEFIKRYEEILSSEKNKIIQNVRKSKKYWINLRSELIEQLKEDTELVDQIKNLNFKNKRLSADEKDIVISKLHEEKEDIVDKLEQIFNYNDFSRGSDWSRDMFLSLMGIEVCPYCNRQYITYFQKNNRNRATADLDHYYAQSRYPFLALSIYNFIPSCAICNRNFKGKSDKDLIYPYEECFDDKDLNIKFITNSTDKENEVEYLLGTNRKFEIKLTEACGDRIDQKISRLNNSKQVFNLEEVYNSHKSYVQELAAKVYMYKKEWIDNVVDEYGERLNLDKEKAIDLYFGNYLNCEDYSKKPLAKLTRDILDELQFKL